MKTRFGRLAISGKGIFILSFTVPSLNKKDLRGAVTIELKKRLPFQLDINNVAFDFFVTDQFRDDKGVILQVTCIAVDRFTIDEQIQFLKEMDIRPAAINVVPDALGNLLSYCLEPSSAKKTIALLDLGADTSLLNFYKGKNLILSREIPVGGEHMTKAIAKTITTPLGTVNISFEEAEKIKRNCGIPLEEEAKIEYLTDFGVLRGEQIAVLLRPVSERLIMEINRTFSYYAKAFKTESNSETDVAELFLTGGTSRLKNLDKFLLQNLPGIKKVECLNILKVVRSWLNVGGVRQELMMGEAVPHLAVAFGLCLGNGGRVNLLPMKEKIEQKAVFLTTVVKILFPIILILSLVYYGSIYIGARKYKTSIDTLKEEVNRLEPVANQIKEYLAIKAKIEEKKALLQRSKTKQPLWWGMLKELSNIIPKDVIIEKITTIEGGEPQKIRLLGKIFPRYTIVDLALSQFVMILDESPYFTVETISSNTDMYSPIPAANFEIICQLKY
ncbi:MAG: pilus assembly protein PilM [Candidatus Omnitrophota bacterium]